jgi:hypothetical protein
VAIASRALVAVLLCVPLAARAGKLVVEYTGIVSSVDRASLADERPYGVGDPLGTLIMDTALAPADKLLIDPQSGGYDGGTSSPGFILGPKLPDRNGPRDLVLELQWPSSSRQVSSGDSLSQSLVVEREPGTNLWGRIERGVGKLRQIVSHAVDRLSTKPRVCKPKERELL